MKLIKLFSRKDKFNDEIEKLKIQYSNEVLNLSDEQLKEKYHSINSLGLPGKEKILLYDALKNECN